MLSKLLWGRMGGCYEVICLFYLLRTVTGCWQVSAHAELAAVGEDGGRMR